MKKNLVLFSPCYLTNVCCLCKYLPWVWFLIVTVLFFVLIGNSLNQFDTKYCKRVQQITKKIKLVESRISFWVISFLKPLTFINQELNWKSYAFYHIFSQNPIEKFEGKIFVKILTIISGPMNVPRECKNSDCQTKKVYNAFFPST